MAFLFLTVRHVFYIRMFGNPELPPVINLLIPQNLHAEPGRERTHSRPGPASVFGEKAFEFNLRKGVFIPIFSDKGK